MNKAILFDFKVDKESRKIHVKRSFHAPKDIVWKAWTTPEMLDQWWAPKPYKAVTVSMNFSVGGRWHYYMQSPNGEKHFCLFDYEQIEEGSSYAGLDAFCDENAVLSTEMPRMQWRNQFSTDGDDTIVAVDISFEKVEDLEKIVNMGFKEGFTMGLQNLDEYIKVQFQLWKDKKPENKARVSAYLNFDGKTEEAFSFYKSVFKTEFVNGIQRFGDIPPTEGQPPASEALKNMVIHVQLPLIGGFVLMGTDAPREMGFTVTQGNNMYINLEPDSRAEAKRLFDELSEGGSVEIPIQDMFWGAYYACFTDKFGINWMVHYQDK